MLVQLPGGGMLRDEHFSRPIQQQSGVPGDIFKPCDAASPFLQHRIVLRQSDCERRAVQGHGWARRRDRFVVELVVGPFGRGWRLQDLLCNPTITRPTAPSVPTGHTTIPSDPTAPAVATDDGFVGNRSVRAAWRLRVLVQLPGGGMLRDEHFSRPIPQQSGVRGDIFKPCDAASPFLQH